MPRRGDPTKRVRVEAKQEQAQQQENARRYAGYQGIRSALRTHKGRTWGAPLDEHTFAMLTRRLATAGVPPSALASLTRLHEARAEAWRKGRTFTLRHETGDADEASPRGT